MSDFMHALIDAELLTAKSLAYDAETTGRTAYRIITPQEALAEVAAYDECLHILHRGRKACVEQPTSKRHKLTIGGAS